MQGENQHFLRIFLALHLNQTIVLGQLQPSILTVQSVNDAVNEGLTFNTDSYEMQRGVCCTSVFWLNWSQKEAKMHPRDLYNETLVAASVAESEGFEGMAAAFREVAAELFMELDRSEQKVVVAEVKQNSNRKLTLVC